MYDYLTELHQPTILSENNNEQEHIRIVDNSNLIFNQNEQQCERNGRSALNCSCSRTISGENIQQMEARNRQQQPRICSLS
jgi:hypothetical protein